MKKVLGCGQDCRVARCGPEECLRCRNNDLLAPLEQKLAAALYDMKQAAIGLCIICKNHYRPDPKVLEFACKAFGKLQKGASPLRCGQFEWRGVCAENTKEAENAED